MPHRLRKRSVSGELQTSMRWCFPDIGHFQRTPRAVACCCSPVPGTHPSHQSTFLGWPSELSSSVVTIKFWACNAHTSCSRKTPNRYTIVPAPLGIEPNTTGLTPVRNLPRIVTTVRVLIVNLPTPSQLKHHKSTAVSKLPERRAMSLSDAAQGYFEYALCTPVPALGLSLSATELEIRGSCIC